MSVSSVKTGATGISLLTGNAFYEPGDFDSIATVTVGAGGTGAATFTSIPSTYTHLQVRYTSHSAGNAADYTSTKVLLNNDTGANYAYHRLYGNGSTVSADASTSQSQALATWSPDELNPNVFGVCVIDIFDYANTSKYKTIRVFGGFDKNGSGLLAMFSGLWRSTSAITRLDFATNNGQNLAQYSKFALYGITA